MVVGELFLMRSLAILNRWGIENEFRFAKSNHCRCEDCDYTVRDARLFACWSDVVDSTYLLTVQPLGNTLGHFRSFRSYRCLRNRRDDNESPCDSDSIFAARTLVDLDSSALCRICGCISNTLEFDLCLTNLIPQIQQRDCFRVKER